MSCSTPEHSLSRAARLRRPISMAPIIGAATLALILSGCGASSASRTHGGSTAQLVPPGSSTVASTPSSTGGAQPSASGTVSSHTKSPAGKARNLVTGSRSIKQADVTKAGIVQHSKGPGDYEGNTPPPSGPNPCVFVSDADATSIIGEPIVAHTEAPLGPTCVFELKGHIRTVTIAVESQSVMSEARYMRARHELTIGGHSAYCGVLGQQMLDLALGSGEMLNVTAPCTVAEALAAKALTTKALAQLAA